MFSLGSGWYCYSSSQTLQVRSLKVQDSFTSARASIGSIHFVCKSASKLQVCALQKVKGIGTVARCAVLKLSRRDSKLCTCAMQRLRGIATVASGKDRYLHGMQALCVNSGKLSQTSKLSIMIDLYTLAVVGASSR